VVTGRQTQRGRIHHAKPACVDRCNPLLRNHIILNNPLQVKYSRGPGNLGRHPRPSPDSLIRMNELTKIAAQIGALLILSASVAFISNAARENRLPLVMPFPPAYQCASLEKPGLPMDPYAALKLYGKPGTVFIDARKPGAFHQGHIEGARPIPYSFVEPLSKEIVAGVKDYTHIIVYDNGKDSEASKLMAGELAQSGVKGAVYLEKGFLGWVKAGGRYTGKAPEGYDE
jgi:rhodanese-related sulfurtransferase